MYIGAFIVPTGIGASIGGFAGDAGRYARKLSKHTKLIVNPNVVNAACFSAINDNMLYVEGYSLDEFFRGKISLKESHHNKIGVAFDKAIPQDVLNVHINTINAVKIVYGIDIIGYEVTAEDVGVEFYVDKNGISTGNVKNLDTLKSATEKLLKKGADAIAIVCMFPDDDNTDYENGVGVDPVGGVEAIISHYISREFKVPCAHAPAFKDFSIYPNIVDGRCAAEYITPTFLPCILLGLDNAPLINPYSKEYLTVDNVDFIAVPYNALGGIPALECIKRGIKVFAVKENSSMLNVTTENFVQGCTVVDRYDDIVSHLYKAF